MTRDISSKGIFVYSDAKPPAKADLHIDISFQDVALMAKAPKMSVRGLVIRVEAATKPASVDGFAILNRSYELSDEASVALD